MAGNSKLARMPIMATTTSNSINVNARARFIEQPLSTNRHRTIRRHAVCNKVVMTPFCDDGGQSCSAERGVTAKVSGCQPLTAWHRCCKRRCMTKVVSLRVPSDKVAAIDRRAADSGMDRTKYLLGLVEKDLARPAAETKRRFASMHLLGRFQSKGSTNAQVRAALKAHSAEDR